PRARPDRRGGRHRLGLRHVAPAKGTAARVARARAGRRPDGTVRLDHSCAEAGTHRLLGVELTNAERALLLAGKTVMVVVACDRCIWERRLVLREAGGPSRG